VNYQASEVRYQQMQYRRCGKSGLILPALTLGLWHNFGGVDIFETGRQVVRLAFDSGITHFDLANNYGPPFGSAEENFGSILNADLKPYRDELIITTKAGYRMWPGPYGEWGSKKYLVASLDQSLKRMGLDYVDIYYSHRPDTNTPLEETMGALDLILRQGKALYVGISSYNVNQTKSAVQLLKEFGSRCIVHQPSYSLLNRDIENGLLQLLQKLGLGCVAFSPLAQGILTGKYLDGIPQDSRAANPHGYLNPEHVTSNKIEKVKKLKLIADRRNQSLAQFSLAWILVRQEITSVIVGCRTPYQLEHNLKALDNTQFSTDELAEIDAALG